MPRSLFVAACGVLTILAGSVNANSAENKPAPVAVPVDALRRLKSGDPQAIESALGDVRMAGRGGKAAVPTIVGLLRRGLPAALTLAAIDTLGDTESEASSEVIAWYARHRSLVLRRSAVAALAKTRGAAATKALRLALSDADATVRGGAAAALGGLKANDAVFDLFTALEHNVPEAAASIGALCSARDCEKLAGMIGRLPFEVVTSGLGEVLLRPSNEVSDEIKVGIVARLRALETAEANRFLRAVQGRYPASASPHVKQAIDEAVTATRSSPGSTGESLP